MTMVEWRMGQEVPVEQRKKEQRCPNCTWVDVRSYGGQGVQWLLGEPCAEHMDPPSSYYHREAEHRPPPAPPILPAPWVTPTLAERLARCWHEAMAELDEIDRRNGLKP